MAGPAHRRHYLRMPSPLHIRTYHELTEADRSGLGEQVGAQHRRVAERLAPVHRVVAVMSGKGGVGKSFVTALLARALARAGRRVGALDADPNGPTLVDLLPAPPDVLAVTIATVESADAVRRALNAARERGARLLGVIENMAGPQFPGDAGDTLSREFAIPLLARIPFNPGDAMWQTLGERL